MNIVQIGLLSLIEGFTEFLPVSSTGHLILASSLMGLPQTDAMKSFEIAVQSGAILAVVLLYGKRLLLDRRLIILTLAGFVPTAVIGFVLHGFIKNILLSSVSVVLASLFIGGVVLILFEKFRPARATSSDLSGMTVPQAIIVGLCQSVAVIPGVSRSAATIIGGEMIGLSRVAIVEFSFLLAIPTMAAATGYDLLKSASAFSPSDLGNIAVGFVLSFVFALIAVKWFIEYVKRHSFVVFGIYRIIVACMFAAVFLR